MRNKRIVNYQQERDYIDDCLRHVGSKQHLFYETHVCTIYRINANPAEHFNETKALVLLEKYRRKRQSHCTGSLLEDRISFERNKASDIIFQSIYKATVTQSDKTTVEEMSFSKQIPSIVKVTY
ncbi:hypothetical protein EWB00_005443 [Schistosoma japonicum]|uniref:Trematode PH-like domain-containing protein n=1 Tax=Schistosoma japonicum TaxID=6182 RepID=A0A4Z2DUM7_SCHJA|nr:hypothetical protein EWB00_005443 [Schistosoma japonicum]